jgi:hypothetical protein
MWESAMIGTFTGVSGPELEMVSASSLRARLASPVEEANLVSIRARARLAPVVHVVTVWVPVPPDEFVSTQTTITLPALTFWKIDKAPALIVSRSFDPSNSSAGNPPKLDDDALNCGLEDPLPFATTEPAVEVHESTCEPVVDTPRSDRRLMAAPASRGSKCRQRRLVIGT